MAERKEKNLVRRYLVFTCGVILNASGVAVITSAGLGTTPVSSLAYVLSMLFSLSFGTLTLFMNVLMVFLQAMLLKREFQFIQYLQVATALVFGVIIDAVMMILRMFPVDNYVERFGLLLVGSALLAIGICFEVYCNVMYIPGEGLVKALSLRMKREFGIIKLCLDVALVCLALTVSFFFLSRVIGLREGTLFCALTVGLLARFFIKKLRVIERWVHAAPQENDSLP